MRKFIHRFVLWRFRDQVRQCPFCGTKALPELLTGKNGVWFRCENCGRFVALSERAKSCQKKKKRTKQAVPEQPENAVDNSLFYCDCPGNEPTPDWIVGQSIDAPFPDIIPDARPDMSDSAAGPGAMTAAGIACQVGADIAAGMVGLPGAGILAGLIIGHMTAETAGDGR